MLKTAKFLNDKEKKDIIEQLPGVKKVYRKRNLTLILGDSREVIRGFPEGFFDAIITDPPYGIDKFTYDSYSEMFFNLEDEFYRVLKKDSWFVFWYTIKKLNELGRFKKFQYRWMIIVLFQGTVSKSFLGDRKYAPVVIFSKGNPSVHVRSYDVISAMELPNIASLRTKAADFKPTLVQSYLLETFAGKKARVLDPFAGFSSLLLAATIAKYQGEVIGIEKDEVRFEVSKRILKKPGIFSIPEMIKKVEKELKENERKKRKNVRQ
jgi:DNA modification methylase